MLGRSLNALSIKHVTNLLPKNDFLYEIFTMQCIFFIDEQIFYFNKHQKHVHTVFFFQQKPSSRPKQS